MDLVRRVQLRFTWPWPKRSIVSIWSLSRACPLNKPFESIGNQTGLSRSLSASSEGTSRFEFGINARSEPCYAEQRKAAAHDQHDADVGNEVCDFGNRTDFPQDQRKDERLFRTRAKIRELMRGQTTLLVRA